MPGNLCLSLATGNYVVEVDEPPSQDAVVVLQNGVGLALPQGVRSVDLYMNACIYRGLIVLRALGGNRKGQ